MLPLIAIILFYSVHVSAVLVDRDLNAALLPSYDYIVCGCGIAGLVVANRLSEDPNINVLCIEAGIPDQYESIIQVPINVGQDVGGIYDWNLGTTPQTQLDGATRPLPMGKVLGGGSILNAMTWTRGGREDYDAWAALGNPGWSWNDILPYFKKSETFTPVENVQSAQVADAYSIHYDPTAHGYSGPVQVSYPKYFYRQSINFFRALNLLGVPTTPDCNNGYAAGAAFSPTDIDPANQTRSDARRTYHDPVINRPNFHVLTGHQVTRLLVADLSGANLPTCPSFGSSRSIGNGTNRGLNVGPADSNRLARKDATSTSVRIMGVEFASDAFSPRQTALATREVIIAAGALHSPQLLQLSGFGSSALLQAFNISVVADLPGVGNNLQDHCLVGTFYPYNNASYNYITELSSNATYNAAAGAEYSAEKIGPWTAGSANALAFPPLPLISQNSASIIAAASQQGRGDYLTPGLHPSIINGYQNQKAAVISRLGSSTSAAYEIINNNAGSLTVAVMRPLSRGVSYINSIDPFQPPQTDPRWLSNPIDRQVLLEALLFNRQILATPMMAELQPAQFVPGPTADLASLNQTINTGIRTEFHYSGTLSMLPLDQGGVVNPNLVVYGTRNLRVVDTSIYPILPASHLQAVAYAVAEKAADLIKLANMAPALINPSSQPTCTTALVSTQSANDSSMSSTSDSTSSSVSLGRATQVTISMEANNNSSDSRTIPQSTILSTSPSIIPSAFTSGNYFTPSSIRDGPRPNSSDGSQTSLGPNRVTFTLVSGDTATSLGYFNPNPNSTTLAVPATAASSPDLPIRTTAVYTLLPLQPTGTPSTTVSFASIYTVSEPATHSTQTSGTSVSSSRATDSLSMIYLPSEVSIPIHGTSSTTTCSISTISIPSSSSTVYGVNTTFSISDGISSISTTLITYTSTLTSEGASTSPSVATLTENTTYKSASVSIAVTTSDIITGIPILDLISSHDNSTVYQQYTTSVPSIILMAPTITLVTYEFSTAPSAASTSGNSGNTVTTSARPTPVPTRGKSDEIATSSKPWDAAWTGLYGDGPSTTYTNAAGPWSNDWSSKASPSNDRSSRGWPSNDEALNSYVSKLQLVATASGVRASSTSSTADSEPAPTPFDFSLRTTFSYLTKDFSTTRASLSSDGTPSLVRVTTVIASDANPTGRGTSTPGPILTFSPEPLSSFTSPVCRPDDKLCQEIQSESSMIAAFLESIFNFLEPA